MQSADAPGKPLRSHSSNDKDYILDAIASYSVDVPLGNLSFQDEAICCGYQYPLDDSLERNYRSDFFRHLPDSNPRFLKESLVHRSVKDSENLHYNALSSVRGNISPNTGVVGTRPSMESDFLSKAESVEAAMALGAGRAAGLIPLTGDEAFNEVRTTIQPSKSKRIDNVMQTNGYNRFVVTPALSATTYNGVVDIHASLQKSRTVDAAPKFANPSEKENCGAVDFPHFSLPAAETGDTPHPVSVASGATYIEQVEQQQQEEWYRRVGKDGLRSGESSLAESISTVMTRLGSCKADFQKQWTGSSQVVDDQRDSQLPACSLPAFGSEITKGKKVNMPDCFNSIMPDSAFIATVSDTPNPATSLSRGSGNSTEKCGKEVDTLSKRRVSQGNDSEYQSEDVEEVAGNTKRSSLVRSNTSKRSRAAEIHNQSERRRRDRINDKMRALQELIPNSNKTDKASMLDEAIQYLKMLQSQVQMMSVRTGIGIPLTTIPVGMQHLQMQQMTTLPHVRGEMGMNMGMSVTCLGVEMSAGRGIVPVSSTPGQAIPVPAAFVTGFQPSVSTLSNNESQQLQSSNIPPSGLMDLYNFLTCQEQPVHFSMDMDMHDSFWKQQQQQSQLLQGISWSKSTE